MTSDNTLRLASCVHPHSLIPGLASDPSSRIFARMVSEGLMRITPTGEVAPALAEFVEISPQKTTYSFILRETTWADGEAITAQDFVRGWTAAVARPHSATATAFFPILGARAAFEGSGRPEDIGVIAKDARTLVVHLEHMAPYFLELTASPLYAPQAPGTVEGSVPGSFNGPFELVAWDHKKRLLLRKNPRYWDAQNLSLEHIDIQFFHSSSQAVEAFESDQIDLLAEPLVRLAPDVAQDLAQIGVVSTHPAAGTFGFEFHRDCLPFRSERMRRAFAYAIDREGLVRETLRSQGTPSTSLLPPMHSLHTRPLFRDGDEVEALRLFGEACDELGITPDEIPPIKIGCEGGEAELLIAQGVADRWRRCFDISVTLEQVDPQSKLSAPDPGLHLLGRSWHAWASDPHLQLSAFSTRTRWRYPKFQALLQASDWETQTSKRRQFLKGAEELIVHDMPFVPVHCLSYALVHRPAVSAIFVSKLGGLDLRWASLTQEPG